MALDTTNKLKVIETDKQIETMENPPGIYPGQLIIQDDGKMYYDNVKKARIPISGGSGGGSSINVVNNLTSTSTTDALAANQGKVLNDTKLDNKLLENWHIYPSGQTAILYKGSGYPMDISEEQAFKYGKINPHLCNVLSVTDGSFQNIKVYLDSPLTVTLEYNGYSDILIVKGMLHRTLISSCVGSYTFELKGGVISENTYALSFTISAQDVLSISDNSEISYTLTEDDVMIYSNDNYTNTNAYTTLLAAMRNLSDELVTFTNTPMPHVSTVSLKLKNINDGDVIYWNGQSFCNLSGIASSSGGTTLTDAQLKAIANAGNVLEVGSTGDVTLNAKTGGNMIIKSGVTLSSDTLQLNSTSGWKAIRANISTTSTPSYQSLPDYIDSKISSSGGLTEDQATVLSKLSYTSATDTLYSTSNISAGKKLTVGTGFTAPINNFTLTYNDGQTPSTSLVDYIDGRISKSAIGKQDLSHNLSLNDLANNKFGTCKGYKCSAFNATNKTITVTIDVSAGDNPITKFKYSKSDILSIISSIVGNLYNCATIDKIAAGTVTDSKCDITLTLDNWPSGITSGMPVSSISILVIDKIDKGDTDITVNTNLSIAGNNTTSAIGSSNTALGFYNIAIGTGQLVAGKYNKPDADSLFTIGNGTNKSSRANAFTVDNQSNVWIGGERLSFGNNANQCRIDNFIADGRTSFEVYSDVLTIDSPVINLNSTVFVRSWDSLIYSYTDNDGTHRETLNDYVNSKISASGGLTSDQQNVLSQLSYVATTAEYPSMLKSSTNLHLKSSDSFIYFGEDPALCYIEARKYEGRQGLDIYSKNTIDLKANAVNIGDWSSLMGNSEDSVASESLVEYVDRKVSSSSDTYILYVENNNSTNTSQSISFGGNGSYFKGVDLSSYSVSVSPCYTAGIMHGVTSGTTFMMSSLPKTIVIESYNSSNPSSSARQTTFTVSNQGSHYSIAASANQPEAGITLIFTKSTNLASASIQ